MTVLKKEFGERIENEKERNEHRSKNRTLLQALLRIADFGSCVRRADRIADKLLLVIPLSVGQATRI